MPEMMTVRERPILFSAPMNRAILAGRKTQTRRIVKPQPHPDVQALRDHPFCNQWWSATVAEDEYGLEYTAMGSDFGEWKCPYGRPGDVLYVRETWATWDGWDHRKPSDLTPDDHIFYKDGTVRRNGKAAGCWGQRGRWRPGIHMPKWASRIRLRITDVRVERVQEISPDDCLAEGIDFPRCDCEVCARSASLCTADQGVAIELFRDLWDSINKVRGGWDANPWVWALTFERVQ